MPIPEILKGTYDSLLAESSAAVLFHAAHIEAQEKSREIAQITERFLTQARQYLAKNTSHVGRSYAQAFENVITTYIQSKQGERMAKQWLDANRLSVDAHRNHALPCHGADAMDETRPWTLKRQLKEPCGMPKISTA